MEMPCPRAKARQVPGGEGLALDRKPLAVRRGQGAGAEALGQREPVMVVRVRRVRCVRRLQRLGPEVPLGGPGQHVIRHPARLRHRGQAHVRGLGDDHVHQVALELRRPVHLPTGVHQVIGEPGPGVDLHQHRCQRQAGQHADQLGAEHVGFGRDGLRGQRRNDEVAIVGEPHLPGRALGQQRLQLTQSGVQLVVGLRERDEAGGGFADQGAELDALRLPRLGHEQDDAGSA
jgi:hypothetical protein